MALKMRALAMPVPGRTPTGIPGLDVVLGGGLPAGRTCLVAGQPGTGKTTLANHMAFTHAAAGGSVIYATLHTETHDIMLRNLRDFVCFDASIPGDRIRYLNLLPTLEQDGLDGVIRNLGREMGEVSATLVIIDTSVLADDDRAGGMDTRRFAQKLEVLAAMRECTAVLLANSDCPARLQPLAAHVNGVVTLSNEVMDSRHVRLLEVTKLRGAQHPGGVHELSITGRGVTVHPRLEACAGQRRGADEPGEPLGTGVDGLDAMLGGGLLPGSSAVLIGTPGAGKTLLGLSYIAEGAARGERGLVAGFHETARELFQTGEGFGLDLARHSDEGRVRVLWNAPLDLSADAWAWHLLSTVEAVKPRRVLVDGLTDLRRAMPSGRRVAAFLTALVNELHALGATTMFTAELDATAEARLAVPAPSMAAAMDAIVVARHVDAGSELRRVVSVLKARRMRSDTAIRELLIDERGIRVGSPLGRGERSGAVWASALGLQAM